MSCVLLQQVTRGFLRRTSFAGVSPSELQGFAPQKRGCGSLREHMQHFNSLSAGRRSSALPRSAHPLVGAHLPVVCSSRSGSGSNSSSVWRQDVSSQAVFPRARHSECSRPAIATLPTLRLAPAAGCVGRAVQRPLYAVSPSWSQHPGSGSSGQQQRGYASQRPWWQFWAPGGTQTGAGELRPPDPLPADSPSAAHARELHTVNTAVVVNAVIFVAKMITWAITGSGALLAEGLHSAADVANQMLLKQGVIRSRRKPTREHQYGFHREKYVYALISAACVFCVGCGASVLHGVSSLLNPHALENISLSLAVLLGSSVLEAYSLRVAFKSIQRSAEEQGMGVWQYVKRGRDPTTVAILWEDGGAVAGLGLAGAFTLLTWMTGQPHWDALGSIAVGLLMGIIAVQLMRTNKRFLIGQAMEPAVERMIVDHLRRDSMVLAVIDPKSEEIGDGIYRFKAEIQWSGEHVVQKYLSELRRDSLYRQLRTAACTADADQQTREDAIDVALMTFGVGVIRTVGSEIDRIEGELKRLVPGLQYVDLETDKGATGMSLLGSLDLPGLHPGFDLEAVRKLYPRQPEMEASQKSSSNPSTSSSTSNNGGQVA